MTDKKHPDERISPSEIYAILADPVRRGLLQILQEAETVTVNGVAGLLADNDQLQQDDPDQLKIQLYHKHLPKLAGMGLVSYEEETETIRQNSLTEKAYQAMMQVAGGDAE